MSIVWSKRWETGHGMIDEQHKTLIDAFNRFHDAMKRGKGRDEVASTLSFLTDYTLKHFREEEEEMRRAAYPRLATHVGIHRALGQQLTELVAKVRRGEMLMTFEVTDFLESWLAKHIQVEDVRFAEYVRTLGTAHA